MTSLTRTLAQWQQQGRKTLALLLDPDHTAPAAGAALAAQAQQAGFGLVLVGGSLVGRLQLDTLIREVKAACTLPVVLFPGNLLQLSPEADAVLFLSLISGRNPEWLIGHQVAAAPFIRQYELQTIATGYMLVEGTQLTAAAYMSATTPLPRHKPDLAAWTALAGQYMGLQALFLDAGSGAAAPVEPSMLAAVRQLVQLPIFCGGGIRTPEAARVAFDAGADVVVVGTAIEAEGATGLARLARALA